MEYKNKQTRYSGFQILDSAFTLVELLIVIAILGVLVTIGLVSFRTSQMRGRDSERKSDLKQIASALELYYSDYGAYPSANNGFILACPSTSLTTCSWGSGQLTDGKTLYFKAIPKDPTSGVSYFYRVPDAGTNQKFQLFAHLENTEDPSCLGGDCKNSPVNYACGSETCNFAVTSPNTSPTQ